MKRTALLSFSFVCAATMAFAQIALPPGASPQAAQDPGYQALMATCKTPRPAAPARGGGGGRRAGGAPAAAPAFPPPPADYTVSAIPGVIAAGQKWTKVWEVSGNNADGIIAADKGDGILIAQNHNSAVVMLDPGGKVSTVYQDTHTGGALSRNTRGVLFIVERGLHQRVEELAPRRHVVADTLANGDPLDCVGGVINDITADSKGGVYYTMGGLFHVDPQGKVRQYGQGLNTNGVVLSPDEKTLYVTNGAFGAPGTIAAFDVKADGSLANQREFVKLPSGGGDGLTVDAKGNLYVTAGPNVHVISPAGKVLGSIPAPWSLISAAFAGKDKKTLYAVVSLIDPNRLQHAYVLSIPMQAQGFKGRAK